jgi:hypothetical protein
MQGPAYVSGVWVKGIYNPTYTLEMPCKSKTNHPKWKWSWSVGDLHRTQTDVHIYKQLTLSAARIHSFILSFSIYNVPNTVLGAEVGDGHTSNIWCLFSKVCI